MADKPTAFSFWREKEQEYLAGSGREPQKGDRDSSDQKQQDRQESPVTVKKQPPRRPPPPPPSSLPPRLAGPVPPTPEERVPVSQLAERLDLVLSPPPTPSGRFSDFSTSLWLPQSSSTKTSSPRRTDSSYSDRGRGERRTDTSYSDKGRGERRTDSSYSDKGRGERRTDSSYSDRGRGEKLPRWRSFSGGKRRHSSEPKSTFVCYLDGPDDMFCESHVEPRVSLLNSPHPPAAHEPAKKVSLPTTPLTHPYTHSKQDKVSQAFPPLLPPPSTPPLPTRNFLIDSSSVDQEVAAFREMVERVESQCCSVLGHLSSPLISLPLHHLTQYTSTRCNSISLLNESNGGSITIALETSQDVPPTVFQCRADCMVRDVIVKGLRRSGLQGRGWGTKSHDHYCLKVCGRDEYLDSSRQLSDYEYVYQSLKFSSEVRLVLVEKNSLSAGLNKQRGRSSPPPPLLDPVGRKCVSRQETNTLLDSYYSKEGRFRTLLTGEEMVSPIGVCTLAQSVISCVRFLCERLSFIETPEVTEAVFNLRRACKTATMLEFDPSALFQEDSASLAGWVSVEDGGDSKQTKEENTKDILTALDVLEVAVRSLVSLYCASFQPGYQPEWEGREERGKGKVDVREERGKEKVDVREERGKEKVDVRTVQQPLRVKVVALHRVPLQELCGYDMLQLEVCVYHGGQALSKKAYSPPAKLTRNFFPTVVWDKWLNMALRLGHIPRESRVCFTLHGLNLPGPGYRWSRHPTAWVAIRLFSNTGVLVSGQRLLGLWMGEGAEPLDTPYCNLHSRRSPILQVAFEDQETELYYPNHTPDPRSPSTTSSLSPRVLHALKMTAQKDRFSSLSAEEQRLIWSNRFSCPAHLGYSPRGLPTLLLSLPHWHSSPLTDLWTLLGAWPCHEPSAGLELLDAQFADSRVRLKAVEWLSKLSGDDLCDFLPQLVQSLRHDCYVTSAMADLLLTRAVSSPRIAHHLYWHLHVLCEDVRFAQRYCLLMSALERLCGETLQQELSSQVELVEQLCAVAGAVKASRDAHRQTTLVQELKRVSDTMVGSFRLPLNPAMLVCGINIESCSFFNSHTVPLRLSFTNADPFAPPISVLFKVGDDLRQDILILQLIRLMDKIWLRAGLDLKLVLYRCVATGVDQGMLEMVREAETLRAIQTQHGLAGSFKDRPLSDWLLRHNPTDSAYKQAVENFSLSCAGYCVATYVLGICDRHNDNIMVKRSGHMFHIDFGKILGNAQMFGNIRRDRAPFVLTRDMAFVINDGANRFQQFTDLCCSAYNELRRHTPLFLSLLSLMLASGLPELTSADDIQYVRDALLPGRTEAEATYAFTKHIGDSLGSLATHINFFIHNLAQFKFSSPSPSSQGLLSLSPNSYSIATDGKILSAVITTFHKRFYPETYYAYQLEVTRADPSLPTTTLFRRYREFDELQNKLLQSFPNDPLPQLPGKIYIPGKSRTRQTSEKRQVELIRYLEELLAMEERVSESDIVYTFLHCLPRDEQDLGRMEEEEGAREGGGVAGRVRVEMAYDHGEQRLSIKVHRVKDLTPREGAESADPYVKLYLLPDPEKATKRKTKVARRTLHPSYNEAFVYDLPEAELGERTLQLSVWDASLVLSKQCLAVVAMEMHSIERELIGGMAMWCDLYSPTAYQGR